MIVREKLAAALSRAVEKTVGGRAGHELPRTIPLGTPPAPEQGDFSSDVAFALARQTGDTPRRVAEQLASNLETPADLVQRVEVTSAGFLNFYLADGWLGGALQSAREAGTGFGKSTDLGGGARAQVEFVSANPTAPLNLAHGRGAALGDALANILEWNGYQVVREYFVNDSGSQAERFGRSLEAAYLRESGQASTAAPVDSFDGADLADLAARIRTEAGDSLALLPSEQRLEQLVRRGSDAMIQQHRQTLDRLGVHFSAWYSERALLEGGKLAELVDRLRASGHTYESDGSVWLRATALGDREDHPLVRSNGQPTYMASDLAYHLDKFQRGFDLVVDVWGPEHADHVRRTYAGIQALGNDPSAVRIVILGPVALKIDGMRVEGTASSGNNLLLDEVLEETGADAVRFLYLQRPAGASLEVDLDLVRGQAALDPIRRIRQAQAAAEALGAGAAAHSDVTFDSPTERALARRVADFADELRAAAREMDPHRIALYVQEIAAAWETLREGRTGAGSTAGASEPLLAQATAVVLRNGLAVLGIKE